MVKGEDVSPTDTLDPLQPVSQIRRSPGPITEVVTFSERLRHMVGLRILVRSLTTGEEAGGDAVTQTDHLGPLAN